MEINELLKQSRDIWGEKPMSLEHIVLASGVVQGDLSRLARDVKEGKELNEEELKKEMGNLIFSAIRWCDDLGFTPSECINKAIDAQKEYIKS
jgi:hypothetical protein